MKITCTSCGIINEITGKHKNIRCFNCGHINTIKLDTEGLNKKALVYILSLIIVLIAVTAINKSCNDSKSYHSNLYSTISISDSLNHIELMKKDSIRAVQNIERQKALDSFNKTPAGKAKLAAEVKAQKLQKLKEKAEQQKAEKKHKRLQKIMDKLGCTEDEAQDILDRKIWIGMTYEMVIYERGRPDVLNVSNYGDGNQYQACWEGYTPFCFYFRERDHIIYSYN